MRLLLVLIVALACLCIATACDSHNGCKISSNACTCGYGCKDQYIYRNRRVCLNVLKLGRPYLPLRSNSGLNFEKNSNICLKLPCLRGICIQKQQEPGFSCKCEGTGYYGQRCEKACPTYPQHGLEYPHECIII